MNRSSSRALLCVLVTAVQTTPIRAGQPAAGDPLAGVQPPSAADSATVDPAAVELLRQAAETIKAATTASYRLRTSATGLLASGTPTVDFQVKMLREGAGWKVRVQGEGKRRPAEEPQQIDAVFSDAQITWIDFPASTVNTRAVRNARGPALQLIFAARLTELLAADPLAKEISAQEVALLGQEEVDGTLCDILAVRTRPKSSRTKWWISQADHFPRRIEKGIESAARGGTSTVDLSDVRIGPAFDPGELDLTAPEGFKRQSDAADPDAPAAVRPEPAPRPPTTPSVESAPASDGPEAPAADQPTPMPAPQPATDAPPQPEEQFPLDLELVDDQGSNIPLASLRGKPVVLVFIASWSLPSRQAVTDAQALRAYCGDQVPLLALGVRERYPQRLTEFVSSRGGSLRTIPLGDEAAKVLKIRVLPAVVVLDAQGLAHQSIEGIKPEEWKSLPATIEQLGGPPAPVAPQPAPDDAGVDPKSP